LSTQEIKRFSCVLPLRKTNKQTNKNPQKNPTTTKPELQISSTTAEKSPNNYKLVRNTSN